MSILKNVLNSKLDLIRQQKETNEKNDSISTASTVSTSSPERETWSGKLDFFLSILGYAVGLGAVWRFPYLCYRNGGGVFLIPYVIFLVLVGIPLVFLELCIGQFSSQGPLTCWTMIPIFKGLGLCINVTNFYVVTYYNMIIAYSIYFFFLSFNRNLPWKQCNPLWSSPNCVDNYDPDSFRFDKCESNDTLKCDDGKCFRITTFDGDLANCTTNSSLLNQTGWWNPNFPSQDYWNKVILRKSSGIDESGSFVWQLVLVLFISWIIVFFTVFRGIKMSGKVVYFTALFPYVLLLILGIRAWTLPGALEGIKFYVLPDFSKLSDIKVWSDAAMQIFFTLGVSSGGLMTLSSYNKFDTNVLRDSILVSVGNCLTSVFAGFVVFAFIGYLSHTTGQEIDMVIQAGQGLSFVVYPYAVTTISAAPVWAVLFFFMMIILGLDTQMALTEITITCFFDYFPFLKRKSFIKLAIIAAICFAYFLAGLLYTIQSGTYWIEVIDNYNSNWSLFLIGTVELVDICWFYGYERFRKDISIMLGEKTTNNRFFIVWKILWTFISPGLLIVLVILIFIQNRRIERKDYTYPYWSHILGQIISTSALCGLPLWALYQIYDFVYVKKKPFYKLFRPDFDNWKPAKSEHQAMMRQAHRMETETVDDKNNKSVGIDNIVFESQISL